MEILVAVLATVLVLGLLLWGVRAARPGFPRPSTAERRIALLEGDRAVVTLELEAADPASEAARRLVDEVASSAFAVVPDAREVEVRARGGSVVGVRRRETPKEVDIPDRLYEPHAPRHRGPDPSESLSQRPGATAQPGIDRHARSVAVPAKPLAERFDLPGGVRRRLDDPDDAVQLVRALLEEGGLDVSELEGGLLRLPDAAVVVVRAPIGEPLTADDLNHAYRRFRESGTPRGLVVTPGFMDPTDVRRREIFVPTLLHAGPEGIQRMADAVELGADPFRFAAGPALG